MKLFIFYPDTYVKRCNDTVLFLGLHNGEYLIEKNNVVEVNEYWPYFEITDNSQSLADKCLHKKLGYVLWCTISPFIPQKKIHVISSIRRIAELMNFNESYCIKDLLRELHLLAHNTTYQALSNIIYAQMKYPTWGETADLPIRILTELANNPIETIIVSGDIDCYLVTCLMTFIIGGKHVIVRTYGDCQNIDKAMTLLYEFPQVRLEVLIDSTAMYSYLESNLRKNLLDRVIVAFLVKDVNDMDAFTHCSHKNKTFIPIIYDTIAQQSVVNEMLLDLDDIVETPLTILDVYKKQMFHPNNYGTLLLSSDGSVFDCLSCIGNIYQKDIYELLNNNLHTSKCSWYMIRRNWNSCKNCVLADICPALSIYELQGIIPCACKSRPIF